MGTEFLKIIEVEEAKKIINNLFNELYPPKSQIISIEDSYNHVVFKDIISLMDLPPFNRSLMDGYAVKSEDTFGANDEFPKILKCVDSIEAGSFSEKNVNNGECIEISTGAPIPDGADAVAMVEFTELESEIVENSKESAKGETEIKENSKESAKGDAEIEENSNQVEKQENIYFLKSVAPNQDLALKGSDIKKDKILLHGKTLLSPDKIGVLAAQAIKEIEVFKKPKIGVISTGNELITEDEDISYGKIYDVNSYGLSSGVYANGGEVTNIGIVKDNYEDLKKKIETSLEDSDIVICSGGTSAGVGDVLRHVLDEIGEVIIHGISVKPGKPTIVGKVNGKLVIGLPGNPVSALIVFYVFIVPNIKKLAGREVEDIEKKKVILGKRIHSPKGRMHYNLVEIKEGFAYPIIKDSGAITSLADADGYIKIPKTTELLEEGEEVEITLFK